MKFKGTIIITDPCYIMPESGDEKVEFTDFLSNEIISKPFTDYTEEETRKYQEYLKAEEEALVKDPDYWRNGDIDLFGSGGGLEKFGFTNWIWGGTIYGDWSCTTYELHKPLEDPENEIDLLTENDIKSTLGQFCADAGLVGVFLLEEVLKFNPDFNYHTEKPWTTTIIKDFDGDIDYIVVGQDHSNDRSVHIVGKGNINFVTNQTGF